MHFKRINGYIMQQCKQQYLKKITHRITNKNLNDLREIITNLNDSAHILMRLYNCVHVGRPQNGWLKYLICIN